VIFWGCVLVGYLLLRMYHLDETLARRLGPPGAEALGDAVWLVLTVLWAAAHVVALPRGPRDQGWIRTVGPRSLAAPVISTAWFAFYLATVGAAMFPAATQLRLPALALVFFVCAVYLALVLRAFRLHPETASPAVDDGAASSSRELTPRFCWPALLLPASLYGMVAALAAAGVAALGEAIFRPAGSQPEQLLAAATTLAAVSVTLHAVTPLPLPSDPARRAALDGGYAALLCLLAAVLLLPLLPRFFGLGSAELAPEARIGAPLAAAFLTLAFLIQLSRKR
jgi:hypothetical protein